MSHMGSETDVLPLQGLTQRQHRDMRARGLKAVMFSVLPPSHTSANRLKLVATRAPLNPKLPALEKNKTEEGERHFFKHGTVIVLLIHTSIFLLHFPTALTR